MFRTLLAMVFCGALLLAACGDDDSADPSGADAPTSVAPAATTAVPTTQAPTTAVSTTSMAPSTSGVVVSGPSTEEIRFSSGAFEVVGDLILPEGEGPFPAVILVSGSGPQTRTRASSYLVQVFGDEGFAAFSWDKPGNGDSTGTFEEGQTLRQRAAILADGIQTLVEHPAVDPGRIGLWGLSQAGWVMPLAMELTDDIAFMISVSGGGEDGIEQMAFQISERLVCDGVSRDQAELAEQWGPQAAKGTTYEEYVEAMEILLAIPGMDQFIGTEMSSEEDWQPWPAEIDAYFDPMTVIEHTTIPVLAIFGELDKNIDPIQGAEAYERALAAAGNPDYHVELIPGIGHTMQDQTTGCIGEPGGLTSERYRELIEEWAAKLAASL
jgi:pimeloyl-ACP methyl ester carboxylesterase